MSPDAPERAVARHATGKVRSADDLARVDTLGFRDEALHAVGAVCLLALTTCESGATLGVRVRVFAGEPIESWPAAHPPGAKVEVRGLFLNLPVRRGFLRMKRADAGAAATTALAVASASAAEEATARSAAIVACGLRQECSRSCGHAIDDRL